MSSRYGSEMEPSAMRAYQRVHFAQEFGWTVRYTDSLDAITVAEIWGVLDAQSKIKKAQHTQARNKVKKR